MCKIILVYYFFLLFCHTNYITIKIKKIINTLINVRFKTGIQLGRGDCGGEISEKPGL